MHECNRSTNHSNVSDLVSCHTPVIPARMHGRTEAPPEQPMHCAFVLTNRKPCKFPPVPDSAFCAHHRLSNPSGTVTRVACPVDPTQCVAMRSIGTPGSVQVQREHAVDKAARASPPALLCSTVPLAGLEKHLQRCPRAVQRRRQAEQPFYRPGCNDGGGDEVEFGSDAQQSSTEAAVHDSVASCGSANHAPAASPLRPLRALPSSADRAAYAARLGEAKLLSLIARVRAAHAEVRQGVVYREHCLQSKVSHESAGNVPS